MEDVSVSLGTHNGFLAAGFDRVDVRFAVIFYFGRLKDG